MVEFAVLNTFFNLIELWHWILMIFEIYYENKEYKNEGIFEYQTECKTLLLVTTSDSYYINWRSIRWKFRSNKNINIWSTIIVITSSKYNTTILFFVIFQCVIECIYLVSLSKCITDKLTIFEKTSLSFCHCLINVIHWLRNPENLFCAFCHTGNVKCTTENVELRWNT